GLLVRLGLRTLGAFAALPAPDVLARFGPDAALAHRLARGLDERPLQVRVPPPDFAVQVELDPPATRVDTAAFAAKSLADDLYRRLARLGLACTRIAVEAETEHGECLSRLWRHEGTLTPAAMSERVRWQLDGWLGGTAGAGVPMPTAGLSLLRLVPDQVVPDAGRQAGFWGGADEAAARAARATARVQGMLGPEAVVTAVRSGGRGPAEQVTMVAWGDVREPSRSPGPPWPGRLPPPAPATVFAEPRPAEVVDAGGRPVGVTGRFIVTEAPAHLSVGGGDGSGGDGGGPGRRGGADVVAWAGPWPVDERWWDPESARQLARMQLVDATGRAYLVCFDLAAQRWLLEGIYD
ncbi:MAG: DNA polymerase Y family protein, partial [Jatrophihabitantaceae bacterium]